MNERSFRTLVYPTGRKKRQESLESLDNCKTIGEYSYFECFWSCYIRSRAREVAWEKSERGRVSVSGGRCRVLECTPALESAIEEEEKKEEKKYKRSRTQTLYKKHLSIIQKKTATVKLTVVHSDSTWVQNKGEKKIVWFEKWRRERTRW